MSTVVATRLCRMGAKDLKLIPESFAERVPGLYGEAGSRWLVNLPGILMKCERRFRIRLETPFADLSWNLVLKGTGHDNTPVVLKMSPSVHELTREAAVLKAYADYGGAEVIACDDSVGALLMKRVGPGTALSSIPVDTLATEIFCDVLQRLYHVSAPAHVPSLAENFSALYRYEDSLGKYPQHTALLLERWVRCAIETVEELTATTKDPVLLHGDLHHDNILYASDRGWVVIDPKGWAGDKHFDTIQYLLNYTTQGGTKREVLSDRIDSIVKRLALNKHRIGRWGIARGVLEACWSLESGQGDWERGIGISQLFADVTGVDCAESHSASSWPAYDLSE